MPNTDKKTIIAWAVIVVLAVGGLWYLLSNNPQGSGEATPSATTTPSTNTSTTPRQSAASSPASPAKRSTAPAVVAPTSAKMVGVTPVSYLLGLKDSLVCSIKTTGSSAQRSGTLYVADGELRADLTGATMISDGAYLYEWQKGATKGLKLPATSSVAGSAIAANGGFDLATPLSFACNPWTTDASFFTPPDSVSFSNSL